MRELTKWEKFLDRVQQRLCKHEYFDIEMPSDWEEMSSSLDCQKCSYSIPVHVVRVKEL